MQADPSYEMDRTCGRNELQWLPRSRALPQLKKRAKKQQYKADITDYQPTVVRLKVCKITSDPLYEKFKRLLNEWQEESMLMSSLTDMVMLPSYRAIIGMGPAAVRLILNEFKHNPDYLFSALEAITEINPVPPEDEGNLERMADDWIEWGRKEGIIA